MTTKTVIQKLVSELCTLPGSNVSEFEPDPAKRTMGQVVRDSLGRALTQTCGTDELASKVVERLMQGQFRPTVAAITEVARELTKVQQALPDGCDICAGMPWISVERVQWEFPKAEGAMRGKQYIGSGSKRCECAKGRWFQQKDRENDAKRAAGLPV